MDKQERVKINDLIVWTDNPRIANIPAANEEEAISLIYEIVTPKKMIALAKNIAEYGLSKNHLPIVVYNQENKKYDVYDGNRRIAVIKDFISKSERLSDIENTQNYDDDTEVEVFNTSKEEAYRLMDLDHAGEQGGKSQISWESFQRDLVFRKRDMKCMYPEAQKVASICGLNKKRDFKKIPYTDLESIFKNKLIKKIWGVKDWDYNDEDLIKEVYEILKKAKPNRISYSRYLPQLSKDTEKSKIFEKKINDIRQFVGFDYDLSLQVKDMYENEKFNLAWIVCNGNDGKQYIKPDLDIEFVHNEEIKNEIYCAGNWIIRTKIKNKTKEISFQVNKLEKPYIKFSEEKFCINNSYKYHQFIFEAKNSKGENCIDEIEFSFVSQIKEIDNDIDGKTITVRKPGEVIVIAKYEDAFKGSFQDDKKYVIDFTKNKIGKPNNLEKVSILERHFLSESEILTFNNLINNLITQIDQLYKFGNYDESVVASTRAIIESTLCFVIEETSLPNVAGLDQKIKELLEACKENNFRTFVADKHKCGFYDIKNTIDKYQKGEIKSLIAHLNLGAHKSLRHLNMEEYKSNLPFISLIIELSYLFIEYEQNINNP